MTTSSPELNPPASTEATILAESIGWLFVEKYYELYTKSISSLYVLYDKEASISHEKFPKADADSSTVVQAKGTDAIKNHFNTSNSELKNKIVITSADFQFSIDKCILIVVFGEWAKGDSEYYQFSQTFLLSPRRKETVYDVANDILKFVNLQDYKVPKVVETPKVEEKEVNGTVEEKAEEVPEVKEEVPEETEAEPQPEEIKEEEVQEEIEDPETKEEEEEEQIEDDSGKSKIPLSWADLAAKEPPKSSKAATVASPSAAKTTPAPPPVAKKPSPSPQAQPNGKYKKEDWFPIYIRNIDIESDVLKDRLVKEFGAIKFFKKSTRVALCDFETKEGQEAALAAKQIKINDNVISLEPREHRDQKAGKTDAKRGRNDKKQNTKKNRSSSRN